MICTTTTAAVSVLLFKRAVVYFVFVVVTLSTTYLMVDIIGCSCKSFETTDRNVHTDTNVETRRISHNRASVRNLGFGFVGMS